MHSKKVENFKILSFLMMSICVRLINFEISAPDFDQDLIYTSDLDFNLDFESDLESDSNLCSRF